MEIRKLTPNDAEEYRFLRLEALQDSPYAFASSYQEEESQTAERYRKRFAPSENAFTFGVFEESQLIGAVTLIREQLIKLNHRAKLVAMYIKPEKRGYGLGHALVSKAIKQAYNLDGVEQIYLSVVTTNISAKKLYTTCGFEVFGQDKRALKFGSTYYDEEHMVLVL